MLHNIIVISLFAIFITTVIYTGGKTKRKGENFFGDTPINKWLFFLGKFSMGATWIFFFLQSLTINLAFFVVPQLLSWIGTIIQAIGVVFVISAFYFLGSRSRFGLPGEGSILITNGIYRISRNPMYFGFFLVSTASCFYCPNFLNPILAAIGILIHHKIVLSEENFLSQQFKEDWVNYMRKVRRYL